MTPGCIANEIHIHQWGIQGLGCLAYEIHIFITILFGYQSSTFLQINCLPSRREIRKIGEKEEEDNILLNLSW